jgi:nucleoside-diphosphate-sugar epimerase
MELAGIAVDRVDVFELADRLIQAGHTNTAVLLLTPRAAADERVELDNRDREALIDVLENTPDTLGELYDAVVAEQVSRSLGHVA